VFFVREHLSAGRALLRDQCQPPAELFLDCHDCRPDLFIRGRREMRHKSGATLAQISAEYAEVIGVQENQSDPPRASSRSDSRAAAHSASTCLTNSLPANMPIVRRQSFFGP
jgi:hypothetical protein